MFNSSSGRSHEHTEQKILFFFFFVSDFGLKNQYKIVLNIVIFFFIVFDANKNI